MAWKKKAAEPENLDAEELMKKYDRESNVRIWEGVPAKIIRYLCAAFSLYCIWVTLFSTGAFQEAMFTRVEGDRLVTGSTDSKTEDLTAKYGESIFGLTETNEAKLKRMSLERIAARIRSVLNV